MSETEVAMSLPALEIPENAYELAAWLEAMLATGDLRGLVAQLSSLRGAESKSVRAVLDRHLPEVLQSGLSVLSEDELRGLLASPASLLELQEAVMIDGGPFWQSKFSGTSPVVESTRRKVSSLQNELPQVQAVTTQTGKSSFTLPLSALALAAAVLLAVFGFRWWQGEDKGLQLASGWGWMNASQLPTDLTPKDYLEKLSAGAAAWSNKRPQDASELTKRLGEFQAGCEILIAADHKPLSDEDRR